VLTECRDLAFWTGIANHPQVAPYLGFEGVPDFAEIIQHPSVLPLASQNGGYLFLRLDGLGGVWELHSLFTPQGWGREALMAGKEALATVPGWSMITTYSHAANWRSRPPRSFGFKPSNDVGDRTLWFLTRAAWEASPAHRS
jgi:hypothetical protein